MAKGKSWQSSTGSTFRCIICLALLSLLPLAQGADPHTYRINTGFKTPVSDIYRLVVEEAFNRLDLKVDFQEVSGERSIQLVNEGIDDGECCRIFEINKTYLNLVPVPVEVINIEFVAFANNETIQINRWTDLAPYDVGVVRGWIILERELKANPPKEVFTLTTPQSMFSMLRNNRIQVATIDRLGGYKTIADMQLQGIKVQEPALVSRPLYLQLNKRHVDLLPRLTLVLAQMRAEGLLDAYYRQIADPLKNAVQSKDQPANQITPISSESPTQPRK